MYWQMFTTWPVCELSKLKPTIVTGKSASACRWSAFIFGLLRALSIIAGRVKAEALLIFRGGNERTDQRLLFRHLADCRRIYLPLPEQEAANIGIAAQITKITRKTKPARLGLPLSALIKCRPTQSKAVASWYQ